MDRRQARILIRNNYDAFMRVACLTNLEYFSGVLNGALQAYLIAGIISFDQYKKYQRFFDKKYKERVNDL